QTPIAPIPPGSIQHRGRARMTRSMDKQPAKNPFCDAGIRFLRQKIPTEDRMNKKKDVALAASILMVLTWVGTARGQAPSGPPKPGPQHKKLAYFAGKWVSEGETKPGPFGPGGKFTFSENCEWFSSGFALVCHSEGKMPEGTVKGLSVLGYD